MQSIKSQKFIDDFEIIESTQLSANNQLIKVMPLNHSLYQKNIVPGQFVQVLPPDNSTLLRRPISICYVDLSTNQLWLLVRNAGKGTHAIINAQSGDILNIMYPLGNGFSIDDINKNDNVLLIGGGVGVAPLLYLSKILFLKGANINIVLGAKTKNDVMLESKFKEFGNLYISTDDGSHGQRGLVTENRAITDNYKKVFCCGPLPMMKGVADIFSKRNIECEVSLENTMGCGIGACLCCVEKTKEHGNVCVCTQGPVFNISQLAW